MAGTYIEILNPGYSTLWTRDLAYTDGTGESDLNPLDPDSDRPLVEGEWLEMSGKYFVRGGDNDATGASGGTVPAYLYFMEKGRYDAQSSKLVHCIVGPSMFEFRTKLCESTGVSVGSALSVQDMSIGGIVRRALTVAATGDFIVGYCTRIYGTDDLGVVYCPSGLAV